jgi:hypothetical protein
LQTPSNPTGTFKMNWVVLLFTFLIPSITSIPATILGLIMLDKKKKIAVEYSKLLQGKDKKIAALQRHIFHANRFIWDLSTTNKQIGLDTQQQQARMDRECREHDQYKQNMVVTIHALSHQIDDLPRANNELRAGPFDAEWLTMAEAEE